jgi:biopolymer transport protein ExbD
MSNVTREPNVTPMLDVMLTLIVIFIFLAQQFVFENVQLHDPRAIVDGLPVSVELVAGPRETLWVDGREVGPDEIAARVKGAPVEVSAQPGASYRDVFHALDVARGAGARVLGLANKR